MTLNLLELVLAWRKKLFYCQIIKSLYFYENHTILCLFAWFNDNQELFILFVDLVKSQAKLTAGQ